MIASLVLAAAALDPASLVLARAESGMAARAAFELRIDVETKVGKSLDRQAFLVQVRRPGQSRTVVFDKEGEKALEVTLDGKVTFAANYLAGQHTATQTPDGPAMRDIVQSEARQVDPLVLTSLDPDGWRSYFDTTFRQARRARARLTQEGWVLFLPEKGAASRGVEMAFRRGDLAPARLSLIAQNGVQVWRLRFSPLPSTAKFAEPDETRRVARIIVPGPPVKVDAKSQPLVNRLMEQFDRPGSLGVETKSEDGEVIRLAASRRMMRQSDGKVEWVFDGRRLSLRRNSGVTRSAVRTADLPEALAKAGTRLDPFWGDILTGVNPWRSLLAGTDIKWTGELTVDGAKTAILSAHSYDNKHTLFVRVSDAKVISLTTEPKSGGAALATRKVFTYFPVRDVPRTWQL